MLMLLLLLLLLFRNIAKDYDENVRRIEREIKTKKKNQFGVQRKCFYKYTNADSCLILMVKRIHTQNWYNWITCLRLNSIQCSDILCVMNAFGYRITVEPPFFFSSITFFVGTLVLLRACVCGYTECLYCVANVCLRLTL